LECANDGPRPGAPAATGRVACRKLLSVIKIVRVFGVVVERIKIVIVGFFAGSIAILARMPLGAPAFTREAIIVVARVPAEPRAVTLGTLCFHVTEPVAG
jgi:hypothetical protein